MPFLPIANLLFKSLLKKESTLAYPLEPMPKDPLVRGHVRNDIDGCIFCSLCQKKCLTHAITVTKAQKSWEISPFSCVVCGACVEACPKKCLHMESELTPASDMQTTEKMTQEAKQETGKAMQKVTQETEKSVPEVTPDA